jgi:predicted enzyme related to lactoylglutathione lyase
LTITPAAEKRITRTLQSSARGVIDGSLAAMTTSNEQLITRVDFIGIPTHDLAAAVEFYGATLGLHRSVYMPERNFAEFETGNLTLNVMNAEAMGLTHVTTTNPIALHVDDVPAARAALESSGVTFAGETFDTGVCHMAFFQDLDGNSLMLHHRYAPR